MTSRMTVLWALAMATAGSLPASGQGGLPGRYNDACVNQVNGAYDAVASADWQARFARSDQNALRAIAGVWYSEVPNPQLNMIAYIYQSFQPNQIYDYKTRTCGGMTGSCTDAYGTGMFAAETQGDGSIFVTTNFSDNNRRNACSGSYVRVVDPNTLATGDGGTLRRAQ